METVSERVAANLRQLREARHLSVRALSARLAELGHPILPSGITKIENGGRRVDVDDLVSLALALGVTPNRLLLPADAGEANLAPALSASLGQIWAWARGESPLWTLVVMSGGGDRSADEALDDFRRHALPVSERLRDDEHCARAAADVLASVRAVLDRRVHPDAFVKEDRLRAKSRAKWPDPSMPATLRARLRRLVAEVDTLIGADDGR